MTREWKRVGSGNDRIVLMESTRFRSLVREVIADMPAVLKSRVDNVDVLVESWPTQELLAGHMLEEDTLLMGLYEGVPLTERSEYGMVLPDRIILFQEAIESVCETDEEVLQEIKDTLAHEVAHHFGIDDAALEEITG